MYFFSKLVQFLAVVMMCTFISAQMDPYGYDVEDLDIGYDYGDLIKISPNEEPDFSVLVYDTGSDTNLESGEYSESFYNESNVIISEETETSIESTQDLVINAVGGLVQSRIRSYCYIGNICYNFLCNCKTIPT